MSPLPIPAQVDLASHTLTLTPGTYSDVVNESLGNAGTPQDGFDSAMGDLASQTGAAFPASDPTADDAATAGATVDAVNSENTNDISAQLGSADGAIAGDIAGIQSAQPPGSGSAPGTGGPSAPPAPTQTPASGAQTPFRTDEFTDPTLFAYNQTEVSPPDVLEIVQYTELPNYAPFGFGTDELTTTDLDPQPNPIYTGTTAEYENGAWHTFFVVYFDATAAPGTYQQDTRIDYAAGTPSDYLRVIVHWKV